MINGERPFLVRRSLSLSFLFRVIFAWFVAIQRPLPEFFFALSSSTWNLAAISFVVVLLFLHFSFSFWFRPVWARCFLNTPNRFDFLRPKRLTCRFLVLSLFVRYRFFSSSQSLYHVWFRFPNTIDELSKSSFESQLIFEDTFQSIAAFYSIFIASLAFQHIFDFSISLYRFWSFCSFERRFSLKIFFPNSNINEMIAILI